MLLTKVGKSDREGTFAAASGNDEDAPIPVVRICEENFLGFSYVFYAGCSPQEAH
jgi:hypothetical protein